MKDFPGKLKELRIERKLTQTQVAKQLSISKSTISGYETNTKTPSIDMLRLLACYYKVSTDYLLGLSPNKNRDFVDVTDLSEHQKTLINLLLKEFKTNPPKKL